MSDKPVTRGLQATRDIFAAVDHYRFVVSADQASRFVNALEEAYRSIAQFPSAGSPRYGHVSKVTDLRTWPVSGFPYVILYVEGESSIDVLRVLHTSRDIPATLRESAED